jgi:hypothetical protein
MNRIAWSMAFRPGLFVSTAANHLPNVRTAFHSLQPQDPQSHFGFIVEAALRRREGNVGDTSSFPQGRSLLRRGCDLCFSPLRTANVASGIRFDRNTRL